MEIELKLIGDTKQVFKGQEANILVIVTDKNFGLVVSVIGSGHLGPR